MLGSSESGEEIGEAYSRSKVFGDMCVEAIGGEGLDGVGKYVGTPVVARDMLEITERAWKRVGEKGEERGIRYWGFSYGSVLGSTFAAMFPDRVERLVVDGMEHLPLRRDFGGVGLVIDFSVQYRYLRCTRLLQSRLEDQSPRL